MFQIPSDTSLSHFPKISQIKGKMGPGCLNFSLFSLKCISWIPTPRERERETESKHKCKLAQRMQLCNPVASEASSSCVGNDFLQTRRSLPSSIVSLNSEVQSANACNVCNIFESKSKQSKSQLHTKSSCKAQPKYFSRRNYRPG